MENEYTESEAVRNLREAMREAIQVYTSRMLLRFGAVKIAKAGEEPFEYTSGNRGPIYIDNRVLVSHLEQRSVIAGFFRYIVTYEMTYIPTLIAGGATAGMPFAQDLAGLMGLPYFYIRKKGRKHGLTNRMVGDPMQLYGKAILVEDLITDAGSKLDFIEVLKEASVDCKVCLVIFDRQQGGKAALERIGVKLYSLTTMGDVLEAGVQLGIIDVDTCITIEKYLCNPKKWAEERGYAFYE